MARTGGRIKLHLTLILSGRAFKELTFDRFALLSIGRSPDCEVLLDNLAVSRRHAEIRNEDGVPVLVDLGSGNGLTVNAARVQRHALNDGDLIAIGKFTLGVRLEGQRSARVAIEGGGLAEATIARPGATARTAQDAVTVHAYVSDLADGGVILLSRPYYLFGRDADVAFPTRTGWPSLLSPNLVAALLRDDEGYRVLDLSAGADAVLVNGAPTADARLAHGDEVTVKDRRLRYGVGRPEAS